MPLRPLSFACLCVLVCALLRTPVVHAAPPVGVHDLPSLLVRTACVVEGDVTDIAFRYDARTGPRTMVTLSNAKPLVGACNASSLVLPVMGGPVPNGRFLTVAEAPRFALGKRYVVFLRNTEWFFTPVHFQHALRVENVLGKEVLVNEVGLVLRRIAESGLVYEGRPLFETMNRPGSFSPPAMMSGIDASDLGITMDRATLAKRLTQFASTHDLTIGGSYTLEPKAGRVWNTTATMPNKRPAPGGGPGCDPHFMSCL